MTNKHFKLSQKQDKIINELCFETRQEALKSNDIMITLNYASKENIYKDKTFTERFRKLMNRYLKQNNVHFVDNIIENDNYYHLDLTYYNYYKKRVFTRAFIVNCIKDFEKIDKSLTRKAKKGWL